MNHQTVGSVAPACEVCQSVAEYSIATRDGASVTASPGARTLGHVVVAPHRHVSRFTELTAEEQHHLLSLLGRALGALERALPQAKVYVLRVGDKVEHVHFHVLPRDAAAPPLGPHVFGPNGWLSAVTPLGEEPHLRIVEQIRRELG